MALARYEAKSRDLERVTEMAARAKRAWSLWTEVEKFERVEKQRSGYNVVPQLVRMKSDESSDDEEGWEWTVRINGRRVAKKKRNG